MSGRDQAGGGDAAPVRANIALQLPRWMFGLALALLVLKLLLVADEEVIRGVYDPESYAQMTVDMVWFGKSFANSYRVGAPMVYAGLMLLGIPWRLGIEVAFLLSALLLARSLFGLTRSAAVFFATFVLVAFHPWPLQAFRTFLSEPVCLTTHLIIVGLFATMMARARIGFRDVQVYALGLTLGICDATKIETPFLVALYAVGAIAVLLRVRCTWRRLLREAAVLAVPLLMLFGAQAIIKLCNSTRCGVGTLSQQESPGYSALMQALYATWAPDSSRYAPVTTKSLAMACDASPTLSRFREKLLDPEASATKAGEQATGRKGEFGPHLNWLLMQNIIGSTERETNEIMLRAAAEIETAIAAGRLKGRFALYPMPPNFRDWVPLLPSAFVTQLGFLVRLPEWTADSDAGPWGQDWLGRGETANPLLFDIAASRRAMTARSKSVRLEGRVSGSQEEVQLVALEDAKGRILGVSCPQLHDAPHPFRSADAAARPNDLLSMLVPVETFDGLQVSCWRNGALLARMPFQALGYGKSPHDAAGGEQISLDLWQVRTHDPAESPQLTIPGPIKAWTSRHYGWFLLGGAALLFLCGLVNTKLPRGRLVPLLIIFLVTAILLRLALYTAWHVTLGYSIDRYMQCFSPLLVPTALLAALQAGMLVRRYSTSVTVSADGARPVEPGGTIAAAEADGEPHRPEDRAPDDAVAR